MLRLMKLAVYALAGYAAYEFVRGMSSMPARPQEGGNRGGREGASREQPAQQRAPQGQSSGGEPQSPLMGGSSAPQGMSVETEDQSGATLTERVGRGVIPQT